MFVSFPFSWMLLLLAKEWGPWSSLLTTFFSFVVVASKEGGDRGWELPKFMIIIIFLRGLKSEELQSPHSFFFSFSFFLTCKKLGVSNYPLYCFLIFVFWCKGLTCLFKDFFFIFWTYFWQVIHIKIMKNPFFTHYHAKKMDFFGGFLFSYIYSVTRCFFIHFV